MQGFNVIILWKEPQAFLCNISIPTNPGNSYAYHTATRTAASHICCSYRDLFRLKFLHEKKKGQLFFFFKTPPPLQYPSLCYSSTNTWDETPPKIIEKKREMYLEDS